MQKRSGMWEPKRVQMVQLPSLEECKAAFRLHMADHKWEFECSAVTQADEATQALTHSASDMCIVPPPTEYAETLTPGQWHAAFAKMAQRK